LNLLLKKLMVPALAAAAVMTIPAARAAELSNDAKAAIPKDVQR
jgi:hypothetical protein